PRQVSRTALCPDAHGPAAPLSGSEHYLRQSLNLTPAVADKDHCSSGKVFPADSRFDFRRLYDVLTCPDLARAKARVATNRGWFVFNAADGLLDCVQVPPGQDSRIEIVTRHDHSATFWSEIDRCLL
ncbi:MAG: CobW family GTP-binding protein, partial [Gammaproteobacteria bacterium]